ncbi:MAG TPA: hypothetical protein VN641_17405 [Urbifossiella sp.]|nr:hypothetical protein [Urbifossiella sp.]
MFARSTTVAIASLVLVGFAGCGPAKLDETKTLQVDSDAQILQLDPQAKPQSLRVQFESARSPVTVLLVKASDVPGPDDAVYVSTDKAIAFMKGEKSGEFSGEVPANTATVVIVRDAKGQTSVKVHITN